MSSTQKVAVHHGASQESGGARSRVPQTRVRVVATSRSIGPSGDPEVLTVPPTSPSRSGAHVVQQALARFAGSTTA